jgi:hypothetical protein
LKQNSVVMEAKFPVYLETNVYYYPWWKQLFMLVEALCLADR